MFESEAACHAAVREGGPELNWRSGASFTDEDAQWIASALANHEVHKMNTRSDGTTVLPPSTTSSSLGWLFDNPCTAAASMPEHLTVASY